MKNFDIEQLERKNIYTVPDFDFSDVQQKVLQKNNLLPNTISIHQHKKNKLPKWWYSVAALLALIVGLVFFFNTTDDLHSKKLSLHKINPIVLPASSPNDNTSSLQKTVATEQPEKMSIQKEISSVQHSTLSTSSEKLEINFKKNKQDETQMTQPMSSNEKQLTHLLAAMNKEEISALEKNTEQDIYLDLYNTDN